MALDRKGQAMSLNARVGEGRGRRSELCNGSRAGGVAAPLVGRAQRTGFWGIGGRDGSSGRCRGGCEDVGRRVQPEHVAV